jgi:hypothetical protein
MLVVPGTVRAEGAAPRRSARKFEGHPQTCQAPRGASQFPVTTRRPPGVPMWCGSLFLPTVASTAAEPGDNSRQVGTAVDHRSRTRPMPDNPVWRAHSYGSDALGNRARSKQPSHRTAPDLQTPRQTRRPRPGTIARRARCRDMLFCRNERVTPVHISACRTKGARDLLDSHFWRTDTGTALGRVVPADRRTGCFRVRHRAISGRRWW